ncbi:MAG: enoyl-CoA hydratase/isomerase family protein [Desulfobacterales bacterium]|nr:enoyl-CoA hydratase/isomerase family protein [Desulfobacterales bacterium]MBI5895619.1 enoyl-CoA hydratase/isomerase family protein [Desulfobacterales bacterium]
MEELVLLEIEDHVATLTLNRPETMNSFNVAMVRALGERLAELRFDKRARAVIVTGSGDKAFSAGADLKERAGMTPEQVKEFIFNIRRLMDDVELFPRPVIAAVNGVALGGGTELALASDIRLASETATMGLTETRLAIIPGAGGTQRLPRLVGKGIAKELIFTGRRINAQESLRIGLVNGVYPPAELLAAARRLADEIGQSGPIAVEQAKYAINRGLETDMQTGLAIESNAYWLCIPTEDRLEGLTAFREKRKPVYKGK